MNIFVTVGSGDYDILLELLDICFVQGEIEGDVIYQTGNSNFIPNKGKSFKFAKSLDKYFQWADLIITHGGTGTIIEALKYGNKVLAIPNPSRTDNHQVDIVKALSRKRHLMWMETSYSKLNILKGSSCVYDIFAHIDDTINSAKEFKCTPYEPPECIIAEEIDRFLDEKNQKPVG